MTDLYMIHFRILDGTGETFEAHANLTPEQASGIEVRLRALEDSHDIDQMYVCLYQPPTPLTRDELVKDLDDAIGWAEQFVYELCDCGRKALTDDGLCEVCGQEASVRP